jgi:glycosyltransferase involved in cell wall biosynthesis
MRSPRVLQMIECLLQSVDIVKIGSPELIPFIQKYNPRIICQSYAVDLTLLQNITSPHNANFTIGYAGTINHHLDFQHVIEPIVRIAGEFPWIHWNFIGCLPAGIENLPNHSYTPFIANYRLFLQELYQRQWAIGLVPLEDISHNRCKTDNKLREYGACCIAGIYSDIPPYSTNVQHGETGLLTANNEQAWYMAMKTLITDDQLRVKIAAQAHQWVEEKRSIPVVAKLWVDLFEFVKKSKLPDD